MQKRSLNTVLIQITLSSIVDRRSKAAEETTLKKQFETFLSMRLVTDFNAKLHSLVLLIEYIKLGLSMCADFDAATLTLLCLCCLSKEPYLFMRPLK